MCSLMFQKGIVDANGFCDPLEMRAFANREEEEHYTTLKLIIKGKIHTLDERQYLNVLRAYASEDRLYYFRNFTINGDAKIVSALCTLMDLCYRIGVDRTTVYDRSRIRAPKFRIKEWDYYYIGTQDYGLCLTISDSGYVSCLSVSILGFGSNPFQMNWLRMPIMKAGSLWPSMIRSFARV